jgi:hypothetical protein
LAGYDIATRRFIGSVGPNGFANDLSGDGDRFNTPDQDRYPSVSSRTLQTATAIYQADLQNRATKTLFTTEKDETILGATDVFQNGNDWDYTVVVTKRFVHLLTPDGKVVWKTPYEPAYPDYNRVRISFLEAPGQSALWFAPSLSANRKADWKLPTRVIWLARDQGVLKSTALPGLNLPKGEFPNRAAMKISPLLPPAFWTVVYLDLDLNVNEIWPAYWWILPLISLAVAALVWVPAGWWLGRRYSLTLQAKLVWAVFHLLCGIPGFLAFLGIQEWPAREACPNCKKLRVVDREKCEHCGADFPPPERNGTEVFEPLTAVK